jgi:hypothetical protein
VNSYKDCEGRVKTQEIEVGGKGCEG